MCLSRHVSRHFTSPPLCVQASRQPPCVWAVLPSACPAPPPTRVDPQAQGMALQSKFGVAAEVTPLLRHMWLSLLPHTGLLDWDMDSHR